MGWYDAAEPGKFPDPDWITSREKWEEEKGTKMDTMLNIINHHLSGDDAQTVISNQSDCLVAYPPLSNALEDVEKRTRNAKIIVYMEFAQMIPFAMKVG